MTSLSQRDVRDLLAAEPFVRGLARSLVAEGGEDVAQQVWLRALRRGGAGLLVPRAWLARVVRNVAANLQRAGRRRHKHERAAARPEAVPSSLRLLELEETRRSLVAAVDVLPGELRAVILLRFYDGLPPRAIARKLGRPVAVVWRQQQRALALLRQRLAAGTKGEGRDWLPAVLPLALAPRGLPWRELSPNAAAAAAAAPALWAGAWTMTAGKKVLCAAMVALAASLALLLWSSEEPPAGPPARPIDPPAAVEAELPRSSSQDPVAESRRVEAPGSLPAPAGTLIVRVRYADDRTPASGVLVLAWPAGTERVVAAQRRSTAADGTAVFTDLSPGRKRITTSRKVDLVETAEVEPSATAVVDLELAGFTLSGLVVDPTGQPVAGALVELVPPVATLPEPVATTGPDGRFRLRAVGSPNLVGARARGYASSEWTALIQENDSPAEVVLVLPAAGGSVEGIVSGPDGPVAGATVQVGRRGESGRLRNPQQPAVARSDAEGRFRAIGLPCGEQPVQVRVAGFAPWRGECTVTAHGTTTLAVALQVGATLRGVVRDAAGALVPGAVVSVGSPSDPMAWTAARSRSDGTFTLRDLPAGTVEVQAAHERAGKASLEVLTSASAGATCEQCELRLSRGLELRGRVLRESGEPVEGAMLLGTAGYATTDALGRFAIANCPEGRLLAVTVSGQGFEALRRTDIDPRLGEIELRVRAVAAPSARITGVVVDPGGRPLAGLTVRAGRTGESVTSRVSVMTGASGRFVLEPLVPGSWWLSLEVAGHPDLEAGPHELGAGATRDVGEIRLVAGGTVRARLLAGDPTGVRFEVRGRTARHVSELRLGKGELTSDQLVPGDYELGVLGNGIAEETVPFAVRAGEETRLELRLVRGVRQSFEITAPSGTAITLLVRRGDQIVRRRELTRTAQRADSGGAAKHSANVWLAPGSYTVTASQGTLTTTVPFAVADEEKAVLRVELR